VLVCALEERLGLQLDFVCAPQETEEGKQMRDWIVEEVAYVHRGAMYSEAKRRLAGPGTAPPVT
jgi:hypothetical protein